MRWSRDTAYLMGLIATDGCIWRDRPVVSISSCDRCLVAWVKKYAGFTASVLKRSDENVYVVNGAGADFQNFCIRVGIKPSKSFTIGRLKIPRRYIASFLLGTFDGDGSFFHYYSTKYYKDRVYRYRRLRATVVTASKKFSGYLCSLIRALGSRPFVIVERKKESTYYRVMVENEEAVNLLDRMYSAAGTFSLPRKKRLYAKLA